MSEVAEGDEDVPGDDVYADEAKKKSPTVVVLGAGATRGAEFVSPTETKHGGCLPPLNADFFTQLQRVQADNLQADVHAVLKDVISLYGPNFSLTLEEYFTHIEATLKGSFGSFVRQVEYEERRQHLMDALYAVLEESAEVTRPSGVGYNGRCSYHRQLVQALQPGDTIISFNYDCVIDDALRTHGDGKWSAYHGYGFGPGFRIDTSGADKWSAPNAPNEIDGTIRLLKLHGSLNWYPLPKESSVIRLRQKLYKQNGKKTFDIIPPEFIKNIDPRPYQAIWHRAAEALSKAKILALVGFSFPPTDQLVEALFRAALEQNESLDRLIIANPDRASRQRIRSVCYKVLVRPSARVVEYERFADFAPFAHTLLR